ncbi:hypothetical protein ACA910_012471 [Epithemia clementina (nom. ined.)]
MSSVTLIHAETNALTISWPEVKGALRYSLQYRRAGDDSEDFKTLSDNLVATQAKKKNLVDEAGTGFIFRVGAVVRDGEDVESWVSHDDAYKLLSEEQIANRMDAPRVSLGGSNHAVLVSWKASPSAENGQYEIQMRANVGGSEWKTIAPSFSGTEVRKKNLALKEGYQFRLRPAESDANTPFSPPSDVIVALGLSEGMKRLFGSLDGGTLLKGNEKVPLEDALGGKEFVLLYASASWCGPCRNFTPKLAQWYNNSLPANNAKPAEVVFLSADHNESGFKQYYSHMPWLAVDYDDDTREQLMAHIRVSGIPRLVVLDGKSGRIIEDNAIGKSLDINRWRSLAK